MSPLKVRPASGLRSALTLSVLVVVFIGATAVGFRLLFADAPSLATATETQPTCEPMTVAAGDDLTAGEVTVSVFNSGSVSGQANRTLINLQDRGFRPGKVANVPEGIEAGDNVTIITADRDSPLVRLVAGQFKGKVVYVPPMQSQGDNIEVVIGPDLRGLKKNPPASVTVEEPVEVCVTPEPTADPAA